MTFLESVIRWLTDPAHWQGPDGIPIRLAQHVQLSAESVAIGALIALPIGIGWKICKCVGRILVEHRIRNLK